MSELPSAVVCDQEAYARACSLYNSSRPKLTEQFTGYYYLAHASTLLFAIGDPSIDLKDGSHDARKRFNEQHGSLQGLYFGMVIGEHEALFYPKEMST